MQALNVRPPSLALLSKTLSAVTGDRKGHFADETSTFALSAAPHTGTEQPSAAHTRTVGEGGSGVHTSEGKLAVVSWEVRIKSIRMQLGGAEGLSFSKTATPYGGGSRQETWRRPLPSSSYEAFSARHPL